MSRWASRARAVPSIQARTSFESGTERPRSGPSRRGRKARNRSRWQSVTIDTPYPTSALLASFHSGRWVLSQIPPPGTKLESLASAATSSFSTSPTCTTAPPACRSLPSEPSSPHSARIRASFSASKRMVERGFRTISANGPIS